MSTTGYHLPEGEEEWKTGVKFDVVFADDFQVPAYLWDVTDVRECASSVFANVDVVNAYDLTKDLVRDGMPRIPKQAAEIMYVLRCSDAS